MTKEINKKETKFSKLKNLILSKETDFIMEAHNALSAKVVEEAGFKGIWASGLSISTALGFRDANEASWTQVVDHIEYMADFTDIPILLDGDTGYGNFNSVRKLIAKLCKRGIAGVCLEDKVFPKTNSFLKGNQDLAPIDEFCGKIKAAKDSQLDDDFMVVARVEALISGMGMNEALKRAVAYYEAGADAILIHSKQKDAGEILEFSANCPQEIPLIIVPTKYYKTPTNAFVEAKISLVIWANHNLRASLQAMQRITQQIFNEKSLVGVEDNIAALDEVFRIVDDRELREAEKKYLNFTQLEKRVS